MEATIKALEDRVQRLLGRMRELSTENAQLEGEKRSLQAKLAELETRAPKAPKNWPVPPDRVASALREAIRELTEP
jgi:regulator of replication initiation timing